MKTLNTPAQIETLVNKYKAMVGKEVTVVNTAMILKGTVLEFSEDENSITLTIEHRPIQWGDNTFTKAYASMRKLDNFGSLQYTELYSEEMFKAMEDKCYRRN